MANTTYYHGLIKDIDDNGDIKVLYPKTYASDTEYNNTNSHLTANNVQAAIDEIDADLTASDNTKFEFTKSGDNYGYKDANGAFVPFKRVQASKTVTAGTSAITVIPDSGYDGVASVTVNPTPSQSKSASPSVSAQTITPDAGKLLSSVSISAMPLPDTVAKWCDNTLNIVEGWLGSRNVCTDGVTRSVFEIPQGKYYGGRSARDLIGVTDDKMRQLGWHMIAYRMWCKTFRDATSNVSSTFTVGLENMGKPFICVISYWGGAVDVNTVYGADPSTLTVLSAITGSSYNNPNVIVYSFKSTGTRTGTIWFGFSNITETPNHATFVFMQESPYNY